MPVAPPSTVEFPSSEPVVRPPARLPYLPFRRISLPTAPSLLHRQSVVSVASFDSLPEDGPAAAMRPARKNGSAIDFARRGLRKRESSLKPLGRAKEAQRRQVIREFHETERAYVDGLELIYSHFLTPIVTSLDSPSPLLDRSMLTSVFSNFVDIWNLHRSFFSSLSTLLSAPADPPALSPILLSHFPYLSLYTPFVTSFPTVVSSLNDLISSNSTRYNPTFAAFLAKQESDPLCGKLKLRDWLLTIVQRCPRYLLMLKELIDCTDPADPEHTQLSTVHALVSKITLSLNTSLHTHAETLALLALQRATPSLPFPLIAPGRTLLKRGPLLQLERSAPPRTREFLLFSDYLVWLAASAESAWPADWGISAHARQPMARSRSKSEAELSLLKARVTESAPPPPPSAPARRSYYHPPPLPPSPSKPPASGARWVYKGHAEIVDLEVIVSPAHDGEERRLEVLGPHGSFVLYAATEAERDAWGTALRGAKAQLLASLSVTRPDSTLTSSAATTHLRRTLQALPFAPSDGERERRGRVEHWVPAIWIPDARTEGCMRCGRAFGWRRRRHHCRLCGRCVCAACSGRTFYIADPGAATAGGASTPARACGACYETVFPLLDMSGQESMGEGTVGRVGTGTAGSLADVPAWLAGPAPAQTPAALMAIEQGRVRGKTVVRPRSYHQILEDFEDRECGAGGVGAPLLEREGEDEGEEGVGEVGEVQREKDVGGGRREDTVRRSKRFSAPAVALHTANVTARTVQAGGAGRAKRFSLVLGRGHGEASGRVELGQGVAAGKLSALLGKRGDA